MHEIFINRNLKKKDTGFEDFRKRDQCYLAKYVYKNMNLPE